MALDCIDQLENIGASECKKLPQLLKGFITTPSEYEISAADAVTGTQWQTDIVAARGVRIYLWPKWAMNFENISEDQVTEETPLTLVGVRPGQYRFRLMFRENLELHKAMYSHRNFSGRVFLIDNENKIIGTSDDQGVTLKGLQLDNLLTEKLFFNDGSAVSKTPVGLYLADNTDLDVRGYMVEGSSFLSGLLPLTTVKLTEVGTSTASLVTFSVKSELDNVPILGFNEPDFNLTGIGGTVSGVTDPNNDGNYQIAGTLLTSGNIDLGPASTLSVQAYESSGPVAITIV